MGRQVEGIEPGLRVGIGSQDVGGKKAEHLGRGGIGGIDEPHHHGALFTWSQDDGAQGVAEVINTALQSPPPNAFSLTCPIR